jgi:hypothetical protein
MVSLADDGLEVDIRFVDQLVPIEMIDGCEVFLADLSRASVGDPVLPRKCPVI